MSAAAIGAKVAKAAKVVKEAMAWVTAVLDLVPAIIGPVTAAVVARETEVRSSKSVAPRGIAQAPAEFFASPTVSAKTEAAGTRLSLRLLPVGAT